MILFYLKNSATIYFSLCVCVIGQSRETLALRPKSYASAACIAIQVHDYCNECMSRHFPPMSSCCFRSVENTSPRRQTFVSSSLAPALGVNRVSNTSDRWRRLPTSRCPCLFCGVLETKMRSPSCISQLEVTTLSQNNFSVLVKKKRRPNI